jgi:hypothetical protein
MAADPSFEASADSSYGEFSLLKVLIGARLFQLIYMRDLKTPTG